MIELRDAANGWVLEGEMTVHEVDLIYDRFVMAMLKGLPNSIDMAAVTDIDGAGAQLLLAFKLSYPNVRFLNLQDSLIERLHWAGLAEQLMA